MPNTEDLHAAADVTVATLVERGLRLGTAESVTVGLVGYAAALTADAGEVYNGTIVAYDERVKHRLLGLRPGPVVCREAAVEMARAGARVLSADIGIGTTGVAGPSTLEGRPAGTCFVAASGVDGPAWCAELALDGDPDTVRAQTGMIGLRLAADLVAALWGGPRDAEGWLSARLAADIDASNPALPTALQRVRETLAADRTNGESTDALTDSLREALRATAAVGSVPSERAMSWLSDRDPAGGVDRVA